MKGRHSSIVDPGATLSTVAALPAETLAAVLDQSVDCVKLIGLDGSLLYMNANGQRAMEVDDVGAVIGKPWVSLWPGASRDAILDACRIAADGEVARVNAFCPTTKGSPRWWDVSVSPVRNADGVLSGYLSISRDATEAELARQALETTTAEMRHRLKNSYAMIGSLLAGFARGDAAREEFAQEMMGRLSALGTAQTLFAARDAAPCEIADLIPALVTSFDSPHCPVSIDTLSDSRVDQGQADAIALVLGELSVNSAKHGALGGTGTIRISATESDGRLAIRWIERSDRPVLAHSRAGGQGLKLMDRIVRARRGTLAIAWAPDGLDVTLEFELA